MKIGRTVRLLTDIKRKEFLNDTDEKRRIIISIFYPTDEEMDESTQSLYMDMFYPCQEEFVKRFMEISNSAGKQIDESYLRSIKTNTYNNMPISKKDILYPIIIYSPGLGLDRDLLTYNIEKLVSKGYIVITLGHIYDTYFTILPDGEIIEQSEFVDNSTFEEKKQLLNIRTEDIIFLLDELKTLNNKDELIKERLDLDKIGIMGHSLGAAAVFKATSEDARIKAVVMLDGSLQIINLTKEILEGKKLYTPLLNFRRGSIYYAEEMKKLIETNADKMNGEEFKKKIIMNHQLLIEQNQGQSDLYEYLAGYKSFIKLKNSEHLTFTDWPVIFNVKKINDVLIIKEAHEIISEITVKFYNEFLCGIEGDYRSFVNSDTCPQICEIDINL